MRKSLLVLTMVAAMLLISSAAMADTYYNINTVNAGVQPTNTSYGYVDVVSYNSTTHTYSITVNSPEGYGFFGSGTGSAMFAFNVSGGTVSITCGTNCDSVANPYGHNMDGFGSFQYGVYGGTGSSGAVQTFSLSVSDSSFTGTISTDFTTNTSSNRFAVQLGTTCGTGFGVANGPGTSSAPTAGTTVNTSTCGTVQTPEPASLGLLAAGLLGLGGLVRRRKQ